MHIEHELTSEQLPAECIADCSASGPVDDAVAYWREELAFTVNRDNAIKCLRGYGAWDQEELNALSDSDIAEKVLWIACGNFADDDSGVFVLGG